MFEKESRNILRALIGFAVGLLVSPLASAQAVKQDATQAAKQDADAGAMSFLPELRGGFAQTSQAKGYTPLCDQVRIKNLNDVGLNSMETRLLCGDRQGGVIGQPWASIPPNQAAFFAKSFLQSRGYHEPEFVQDGEVLFIDPGPKSRLRNFQIIGGPKSWEPPRRRLIQGRPLTPSLLNELEGWSLGQIKNEGYACATATSKADPSTGQVVVDLDTNELKFIRGLETTGDTGLREGVLDRYNAFHVGDRYQENLISLTRQRIIEDGFLQTVSLSARCEPGDAVTIVRDVALGPSRTVRVGVGGSTEEGARFRTILRQNRIGSSASSAQARFNASYLNNQVNRQALDANFRWFYSRSEERSYLEPSILFDHTAEQVLEYESAEARLTHGAGLELADGQLELRVGPTWLLYYQSRGVGPGRTSLIMAEASAHFLSHDFEFYGTSPRKGSYLTASLMATQKDWGANFTAEKLQLQGEKLWNVFRYDPPLLILGFRFNASSVFTPGENITPADVPARFLTFLGGESDLRGFSRASLPRSGVGALSGVTASFEGRLHKVIVRQADFLAFIDSGMLGDAYFKLQRPIFMSPGVGFRWESPIGVFRVYGARRFALSEKANEEPYGKAWRLGLTYGEEF